MEGKTKNTLEYDNQPPFQIRQLLNILSKIQGVKIFEALLVWNTTMLIQIIFIDAISLKYKDKLADILNAKEGDTSEYMGFSFIKPEVVKLYNKNKVWKMLPYQRRKSSSSLDKALYGNMVI